LTPFDFLAWSFKSKVYRKNVPYLHDLQQIIYEAAQTQTPNTIRDVFRVTVECGEQCIEMEGGKLSCIEYVIQQ
jgi:hypothetical protein